MSGVEWASSPADMARRVAEYKQNLLNAVYALASEWARRLAEEMRQTHPWKNRTGAAERGLFGRVTRIAMGAVLILGGSAPHQIYLERRWGGRYAIIQPTLSRNYAAIMAALQQLVR